MSDATLAALETSCLQQIKQIEGAGQSHSMNGRNVASANLETLYDKLANINAAQAWKAQNAADGNLGYASRYTDFSRNE